MFHNIFEFSALGLRQVGGPYPHATTVSKWKRGRELVGRKMAQKTQKQYIYGVWRPRCEHQVGAKRQGLVSGSTPTLSDEAQGQVYDYAGGFQVLNSGLVGGCFGHQFNQLLGMRAIFIG